MCKRATQISMKLHLIIQLQRTFDECFADALDIGCDDGWFDLIYVYLNLKRAYESSLGVRYPVSQIREKRAQLRVSDASPDSSSTANFIEMAEDISCVTSEMCGEPGWLDEIAGWWPTTACEKHQRGALDKTDFEIASIFIPGDPVIEIPPVSADFQHIRYALASRLYGDLRCGDLPEVRFTGADESDGLRFKAHLDETGTDEQRQRLDDYLRFTHEYTKLLARKRLKLVGGATFQFETGGWIGLRQFY